jgi:hypothetical protein
MAGIRLTFSPAQMSRRSAICLRVVNFAPASRWKALKEVQHGADSLDSRVCVDQAFSPLGKAGFCHFCPYLRAYALTANRGKIKRDGLVTPTQLSPAPIGAGNH